MAIVLSPEQESLVLKHMDYAESVARQTAIRLPIGEKYGIPMDIDDCIQLGLMGLLQAAYRFDSSDFDPQKGTLDNLFKSYAYTRIRGAIIDEVRKQSFVRRRGIEQGIKFQMLSLDHNICEDGDEGFPFEVGSEKDLNEWMDIVNAMDVLDDRESRAVLGVMAGMTGREIAVDLGITESRVSQIVHEARAKLKKALASNL